MTRDHLPECLTPDPASPELLCICDRLDACEQRIANKIAALLVEGVVWQDGFEAGLNAARQDDAYHRGIHG